MLNMWAGLDDAPDTPPFGARDSACIIYSISMGSSLVE